MIVGVPRETYPGGCQVAVVPDAVPGLVKAGLEVLVEQGAGEAAGYPDRAYRDKGAALAVSRDEVFSRADIVLQYQAFGANPQGDADLERVRQGQAVIAFLEPLSNAGAAGRLAGTGAAAFSMELMPRITRAQSMDALSSMATVSGYKAVLLAAGHLPRMFPMMMTAAGTATPARVFVVGAGVAGLQAIATSRRLGAVVQAYDVRPAVKEQVESLGSKFLELELEAGEAEDSGGYAREMNEEFLRRQREMMARAVADSDVVITTAAVPGKKAPVLVTAGMVENMRTGSVVVDLAAERGGNCELTKPGETVLEHGVSIIGPVNLPSTVPYHSSQMYSRNVTTFLLHLIKEGQLVIDTEDEITRETLVAAGGEVVHPRVREILGLAPKTAGQGGSD
ncbi:MAG: Re/Si-specific NAD(P)(+) transhydrogenase subunit alpha [Candidatus Glassbacteria bacterium]|nr:Re/Si-specific NAD(P)(+) transhydrogenase subunit alpha [Candidatus Glassbacteria bacterium]